MQLAAIAREGVSWADYDWRKIEAKLNALPQFITESMGWIFISFMSVRNMTMRCPSSENDKCPKL